MSRDLPSIVRLDDAHGQVAHLDLVRAVALAANTSWEPADAFDVAVQAVCEHTGWPVGVAWLVEDDGRDTWLVPHAVHTGNDRRFGQLVATLSPQPAGTGGVMAALIATASGGAAWHLTQADTPLTRSARTCGLAASAAFCVVVEGSVHGILQFFLRPASRPGAGLIAAMETVSAQLARVVERTATEVALADARARLDALLEHTADAFLRIAADGTIEECNRRAVLLLDRRHEEVVGQLTWQAVVTEGSAPPGAPGTLDGAGVEPTPGRAREATVVLHRPDGDEVPATATIWSEETGAGFNALLRPIDGGGAGADRDPVTLVTTREAFLQRAQRRLDAGHPLAVAILDLDHFARVNDEFGPTTGDQLLRAVGARLVHVAGEVSRVARVGSDEFAVLVPTRDTSPQALAEEGALLLGALAEPFDVESRPLTLRGRVGLVGSDQPDEADATALLHAADAARREGRDRRVTVFDPGVHRRRTAHLSLETALHAALGNGGLDIAYQPIVDLETGQLACVEALARWDDVEHGCVAPSRFIELAEDTGMIHELGRQVLREACAQTARWQASWPRTTFRLAVNLSAAQLDDEQLVAVVDRALTDSGLHPGTLVLEVTESLLSQDAPAAKHRLWDLRQLGVQLAVDDFGTGYASLGRLRAFPFDVLKIDQSFLRGVVELHQEVPLVRAVAQLARALDMSVVAEGVETPAQLAAALRYGCAEAQGYLFARPLTPDAFEQLLRDPSWDTDPGVHR